ncbi:MAG: AMP-binding protein [Burkholderiaceae bacterium]|nr:AMP-binding protein [Burkholderiaceae bacterium]MBP6814152.1 AMP-binding protein [Burkholderiaceae bacterium]
MVLTESYARGTLEPAIRDITLGALLDWAAQTTPDRTALIAGVTDPAARRQWTYRELQAESLRAARALRARFQPGERVAIWAPNIPEWVIMEFGAAMAGLVLVTVNPGFRSAEVEYVLKQSRSAGIFVVPGFRGNPMVDTVQELAPRCPELREIVRFDQWEAFLASGDGSTLELPRVQSTDPVMIQYTSGTTGFPKGALLTHRGLVNNGAHTADRMGIADGDVQITTMPLFHTGGCVLCVLGAVSKRATQVLLEAFDPGLVLELIATYRGNAMLGVPTMLIAMMEHPSYPSTDLSSVKAICSGGSTVPASLVTRLEQTLGAQFTIVFGQTECSPVASMTHTTDTLADKAGTIGPPMPHAEVKIVDPATGKTAALGQIGEYCTRGYHVMLGYFEMPEATAAAIDAEGWLHSGDLCAMDARGYCTVEGRLKDMIIRGGENVYPRELEELLFQHPKVGEVAVVGLPDDKWGEEVAAFIRPAPGAVIDKSELFNYMREHLAPHKTPRQWFVVEAFPLTGSGKIQKYKLREQWSKGGFIAL